MFSPDWKDLPSAFKRVTQKGKKVFRINLNVDEILARLEEGKNLIAIDVICDKYGNISTRKGVSKGRSWEAFNYYAWAMKKKEDTNGIQAVNSRQTSRP